MPPSGSSASRSTSSRERGTGGRTLPAAADGVSDTPCGCSACMMLRCCLKCFLRDHRAFPLSRKPCTRATNLTLGPSCLLEFRSALRHFNFLVVFFSSFLFHFWRTRKIHYKLFFEACQEKMGRRGGGAARGAKGHQSARKPALPHTEAYQRMNFLYHAAHQVVATNPALARLYIRNMVLVAQKLVLRMCGPTCMTGLFLFYFISFYSFHFSISLRRAATVKATYCKGCFSLLIPGVSASARISHGRFGVRACVW